MQVLVSLSDKSTYAHEAEIDVPSDGAVQIFARGSIGPGAIVLLLKGSDGVFHAYPEFTFGQNTAAEIEFAAGDKLKVEFRGCIAAGLELRQ